MNNAFQPENEYSWDIVAALDEESRRYTATQTPPDKEQAISFREYSAQLRLCPAPSNDDIERELSELRTQLQFVKETTTVFLLPVFLPPRHPQDKKIATMGFYTFDEKGFSTDGPFGNEGYYQSVLPEEVQKDIVVDMRTLPGSVGEHAEEIIMRLRTNMSVLRQRIWGSKS